jgi:hypothetical protein
VLAPEADGGLARMGRLGKRLSLKTHRPPAWTPGMPHLMVVAHWRQSQALPLLVRISFRWRARPAGLPGLTLLRLWCTNDQVGGAVRAGVGGGRAGVLLLV